MSVQIQRIEKEKQAVDMQNIYKSLQQLQGTGCRVYEENIFTAVAQISKNAWAFSQMAPDQREIANFYFISGPDRAILIDTGYGLGSLKRLIRRLADTDGSEGTPVIVLNTHYHDDHCGGNAEFTDVRMHPYDLFQYEAERVMDRQMLMQPYSYFAKEDIQPAYRGPVKELSACEVIKLGGDHTIQVFHTPGHTAGGCSFYDRKNDLLFIGDIFIGISHKAKEQAEYFELKSVEAMLESLQNMRSVISDTCRICPGHGSYLCDVSLLEDAAEGCRRILDNPLAASEMHIPVPGGDLTLYRYEYGQFAMNYMLDAVYRKK